MSSKLLASYNHFTVHVWVLNCWAADFHFEVTSAWSCMRYYTLMKWRSEALERLERSSAFLRSPGLACRQMYQCFLGKTLLKLWAMDYYHYIYGSEAPLYWIQTKGMPTYSTYVLHNNHMNPKKSTKNYL